MIKLVRKIVLYIISALLLLFYLYSLSLSKNQDALSDEYKMFFIDNTLSYYLADGELQSSYSSGKTFMYNTSSEAAPLYRNQGLGWGPLGEYGTWADGNDSYFYIYVSDIAFDYSLKVDVVDTLSYNNSVIVNGTDVGVFENVIGENTVHIPSGVLHEGVNVFILHSSDDVRPLIERRPEIEDYNPHNILVYSVTLEPVV